jgi:hypothetical protein
LCCVVLCCVVLCCVVLCCVVFVLFCLFRPVFFFFVLFCFPLCMMMMEVLSLDVFPCTLDRTFAECLTACLYRSTKKFAVERADALLLVCLFVCLFVCSCFGSNQKINRPSPTTNQLVRVNKGCLQQEVVEACCWGPKTSPMKRNCGYGG